MAVLLTNKPPEDDEDQSKTETKSEEGEEPPPESQGLFGYLKSLFGRGKGRGDPQMSRAQLLWTYFH